MKLGRTAGIVASAGWSGAWSSAALAIEDLPGGPKRWGLNLQDPVTSIAADQHWIHWFVMWVCVVIFVAVFGVMLWSIVRHRKSKGHRASDFHESTTLEIAWTIVPFLIIVALSIPATKMIVEQKDTSNADVTIKVTGYQWKWGYDYLNGEGEGISFLSMLGTPRDQIDDRRFPGAKERREANNEYLLQVDNPLVVPVNRKVRVVLTASDVIHAWYVPSFGVKQDAIPGFVRDLWFRAEKVGLYRGQCAELCGKDHAFMPIVVDVRTPEDYSRWVEEKKAGMLAAAEDPDKVWELAALEERGEKVYAANCVACHQANGKGIAGAFPALDGSKVVLGDPQAQIDVVLHGRPGTAMASFKQLSDTDIAAVITFTRHAWDNDAKEGIVQPSGIASARVGR